MQHSRPSADLCSSARLCTTGHWQCMHGGVSNKTGCRAALAQRHATLTPSCSLRVDTMVVGWEAEAPDDAAALAKDYVRHRQLLQWFFAAAPGHPVLRQICDAVAANVRACVVWRSGLRVQCSQVSGPGSCSQTAVRASLGICLQSASWLAGSGAPQSYWAAGRRGSPGPRGSPGLAVGTDAVFMQPSG